MLEGGYVRAPQRSYALLGHSDPTTAGHLAHAISDADLIPVLAFDLAHVVTRLTNQPRDTQFELVLLGPTLTDHNLRASIQVIHAQTDAAIITLSDHDGLHTLEAGTERHLPVTTPAAVVALHAAALAVQRLDVERPETVADNSWGPLHLDPATYQARWDTTTIPLTVKQYEILNALIQARGATVTAERLGRTIYRNTVTPDEERIRAHIRRIRQRLANAAPHADKLLRTVRGIGYRLAPAPQATPNGRGRPEVRGI